MRAGFWVRLGACVKCASCGLRLVALRIAWSDTERDAIFCRLCAEELGAPEPVKGTIDALARMMKR